MNWIPYYYILAKARLEITFVVNQAIRFSYEPKI